MYIKNLLRLVKYCLKQVNFDSEAKIGKEEALLLYEFLEMDKMEFLVFKYNIYTGGKVLSDRIISNDESNPYSSYEIDKAKQKDIRYFVKAYKSIDRDILVAMLTSRRACVSLLMKERKKTYSSNVINKIRAVAVDDIDNLTKELAKLRSDVNEDIDDFMKDLSFRRVQITGVDALSVEHLYLGPQIYNILKQNDINTVGDIAERLKTYDDCMRLPYMNRNCVITLSEAVRKFGIFIPLSGNEL